MFLFTAAGALASAIAGAAQAAPSAAEVAKPRFSTPNPIPGSVVLPGDEALDCPTIRAEGDYRLSQYNALGRESNAIDFQKSAETRALETVGALAGMIPVVGQVIGAASMVAQIGTARKDAKVNYGEIDGKSEWVLNRMSHMHETYRTRCMKGSR